MLLYHADALEQVLGKIITDVLNHQGSFRDVLAQITFIKSVLASEVCSIKPCDAVLRALCPQMETMCFAWRLALPLQAYLHLDSQHRRSSAKVECHGHLCEGEVLTPAFHLGIIWMCVCLSQEGASAGVAESAGMRARGAHDCINRSHSSTTSYVHCMAHDITYVAAVIRDSTVIVISMGCGSSVTVQLDMA